MYTESFFTEAQFFPRFPALPLRVRLPRQGFPRVRSVADVRILSGIEDKYRYLRLQLSKLRTCGDARRAIRSRGFMGGRVEGKLHLVVEGET